MDKLISLQNAIKAIDEKAKRIKNEDTLNGLAGAVGILFDLPPVKPQPKTGHWIDNGNGTISCSHCHTWFKKDEQFRFFLSCPYCKADMKEE